VSAQPLAHPSLQAEREVIAHIPDCNTQCHCVSQAFAWDAVLRGAVLDHPATPDWRVRQTGSPLPMPR
jgi:hypothetical protein